MFLLNAIAFFAIGTALVVIAVNIIAGCYDVFVAVLDEISAFFLPTRAMQAARHVTVLPAPVEAPPKPKRRRTNAEYYGHLKYKPGIVRFVPGRVLADENKTNGEFIDACREAGLSVSGIWGDLKGSSDEEVLEYSTARRAILVTHDTDFLALGDTERHAGVLWVPQRFPNAVLVQFLAELKGGRHAR